VPRTAKQTRAAGAWPVAARAQQAERMRRIVVLTPFAEDDPEAQARVAAFVHGLQQLGWTEGRSLWIDTRWGAGDAEQNWRGYSRWPAQWTFKKERPRRLLGGRQWVRATGVETRTRLRAAICSQIRDIGSCSVHREALSPRTPRCRSTEADCIAVEQPTGAGPTTRPPCQSRRPSRRAPRRLPPSTLPHPCAVARSTR
jgi:hypothetical protein